MLRWDACDLEQTRMHALPQTLQEGWTRGRTVAAASARADKRRVAAVGVPDAGVLGAIVSAYSKLQSLRAKLFFLEFCQSFVVILK